MFRRQFYKRWVFFISNIVCFLSFWEAIFFSFVLRGRVYSCPHPSMQSLEFWPWVLWTKHLETFWYNKCKFCSIFDLTKTQFVKGALWWLMKAKVCWLAFWLFAIIYLFILFSDINWLINLNWNIFIDFINKGNKELS